MILNTSKFEIINGHYADKFIECQADCKKSFKIPEEKCSDINISLSMIGDCINNEVDIIILVTADSDQVSSVKFIQKQFPHIKIKVYFPPNRKSNDLKSLFKQIVFLENHEDKFKNSLMPAIVKNDLKTYTRPENWV